MPQAAYIYASTTTQAQSFSPVDTDKDIEVKVFYRVMDLSIKPLYSIISGKPCPKFKMVTSNDDYSQVTLAFPEECIDALSKMKSDAGVISKWLNDEECPYDNAKDLNDLIDWLRQSSQIAIANHHAIYITLVM